ncbi:transglycosylase SLT domain-containing protein [Sorangium sp. So ce1000]|uniref:transglycosylase SLT domain-containing protein n=1 Tax=Sorangium sp. So ce1000 TaxID=3133325 RepID=UPI003F628FF7
MYQVSDDLQRFHRKYAGSVEWRLTKSGIEVEGSGIERTTGEPTTVRKIWEAHHDAINLYAGKYEVPVELIVATICTETQGNASAVREEPGYTSDDATPHRVSPGIMQTLISTARTSLAAHGVSASTINRAWLLHAENSINAGTSCIADRKAHTGYDPVLVGAAYNAGDVIQNTSTSNRWRVRQFPIGSSEHCDRFVKWFNDFWAVLDTHPIRPVLSFYEYFHQSATVFPVSIGGDVNLTPESLTRYYQHTEVEHLGGYFPLGANTVWHGGVHLHVPAGTLVAACADGEVVAARLSEQEGKAIGHYGSHNFVLVKHEVTGEVLNLAAAKCSGTKYRAFKVVAPALYLRPSPGIPAQDQGPSPLGILKNGDTVGIVDVTMQVVGDNTWMKVKVKTSTTASLIGKVGYIAIGNQVEKIYDAPEQIFEPAAKKVYYSLYMHLNNEPLDAKNARLQQVAWVQTDHFKVVSKNLNLRATPNGEPVLATLATGDVLAPVDDTLATAGGIEWMHAKVVAAADASQLGKVGYSARSSKYVAPTKMPDQAALDAFKAGKVVKLSKKVRAGDGLWPSGQYGSVGYRTGLLHWEIFSEENLLPKFQVAEDDDDDFTMDCAAILSMVEQKPWFDTDILDSSELAHFYRDNKEAAKLRRWACKFASEWGVNLDSAISNMKGRWWTRGLKDRMKPYVWWPDAAAANVPLPPSPKVWHYNPIAFLEMVGAFTVKSASQSADNPGECPLKTYTGSNLSGKVVTVDVQFLAAMGKIHDYAVARGVTINVTDSFREAGQTVSGAIVTPATNSNHLSGHAIDMNVVHNGVNYNSTALKKSNLSNLPAAVRGFIQDIRDDNGLRWGGDFATEDPVHIDDHLNANMTVWTERYNACQAARAAGLG